MEIKITKKERRVIINSYNDACYYLARAKRKKNNDGLRERRIAYCYGQAKVLQGLVKKIDPKAEFLGDLDRSK